MLLINHAILWSATGAGAVVGYLAAGTVGAIAGFTIVGAITGVMVVRWRVRQQAGRVVHAHYMAMAAKHAGDPQAADEWIKVADYHAAVLRRMPGQALPSDPV
jgi:hypothetical protein